MIQRFLNPLSGSTALAMGLAATVGLARSQDTPHIPPARLAANESNV